MEYRPGGAENSHYGRLRSVVTGAVQNLTYNQYDAKGNLTQLIDG